MLISAKDLQQLTEIYDAFDVPTLERLEKRICLAPKRFPIQKPSNFESVYKSLKPPTLPAPQWLPYQAIYRHRFF